MKKTLLFLAALLSACILPSQAQVIVGNFGVNYVTAAPSGSCSSNAPLQAVIGSGAVYSCQSGTWALLSGGGGGGLPAATVPGQIIAATAAGTTYTAQGALYFEQPGDTIASIEAQCSSPCTEVITQPFTHTITANHTLSANVNLQFQGLGSWTVNGSGFTLTIPGGVAGTLAQHFIAGTASIKLGTFNSLVPVEWFGASGGGTGAANLTAIQNTINALTVGQALLSYMYPIAGTISLPSNTGFRGLPALRGGNNGPYLSGLQETTAGVDAIDMHGTSGSYLFGNKLNDFAVLSSVAQTGTAAGISCSFDGGVYANNLFIQDFKSDVYLHACPSYGQNGWNGIATQTDSLIASGAVNGFFLDSSDGVAENSLTIRNSSYADQANTLHSSTAMLIQGTAINDLNIFNFNTATPSAYGLRIDATGSANNYAHSDIHIDSLTVDSSAAGSIPLSIENLSLASGASVTVNDARLSAAANPAEMVYIQNSQGVQILNSQINNGVIGVNINSSYNNVVSNNTITKSTTGIRVNGSTNIVTNNALSYAGGTMTTGISIPCTNGFCNNNNIMGNIFDSTVTNKITDNSVPSGTNGSQYPISVVPKTATPSFSTNTTVSTNTDGETGFLATGYRNFEGWNNTTPSAAYNLGWGVPNGSSAATQPLFNYYNGTSWSTVWSILSGGGFSANFLVASPAYNGTGTVTLTPGAAAGTGATLAVNSGYTADSFSGGLLLTTGTSPTTGTLATIGLGTTRAHNANCTVQIYSASTGIVTTYYASASTTAITVTATTALAASTPYGVSYICGGS